MVHSGLSITKAKGQLRPQTDLLAEQMLRDARMSAMTGCAAASRRGGEWPVWAVCDNIAKVRLPRTCFSTCASLAGLRQAKLPFADGLRAQFSASSKMNRSPDLHNRRSGRWVRHARSIRLSCGCRGSGLRTSEASKSTVCARGVMWAMSMPNSRSIISASWERRTGRSLPTRKSGK